MRLSGSIALLSLALLSGCTGLTPPPQPQGRVQVDCHHFYRNPEGIWQGDGNATAVVDGRRWWLGIEQFTPQGPIIGGQGGVILYNDIQQQCGGGLAAAAAVSPILGAGRCHEDGSTLTASGTIHVGKAQKDEDPAKGYYKYAYIKFDHPICLKDLNYPNGEQVAQAEYYAKGRTVALAGHHIAVTGELDAEMMGHHAEPFSFTKK